jgi:hypothetical protein
MQKKRRKRDRFLKNLQLFKFAQNVKSQFNFMRALSQICIAKKRHSKKLFKTSMTKKKKKKLMEQKILLLSIEFTETVMQS